MKKKNREIYIVVGESTMQCFKNLRVLTRNYPKLAYFKLYRAFKSLDGKAIVSIMGYNIHRMPLL